MSTITLTDLAPWILVALSALVNVGLFIYASVQRHESNNQNFKATALAHDRDVTAVRLDRQLDEMKASSVRKQATIEQLLREVSELKGQLNVHHK